MNRNILSKVCLFALIMAVSLPGCKDEEEQAAPGHKFGIKTVLIRKGTFTMGSPEYEPNRNSDETQHKVTLTQDFWMSAYTITNAQYAVFLNTEGIGNPADAEVGSYGNQSLLFASYSSWNWGLHWNGGKWEPVSGYEKHPAIFVTWFGAFAYAAWVGGRLPTEAQWEYACRAGIGTAYSFGNDVASLGDYAWYSDNTTTNGTKAVGQKKPNAWGLYDMHGNVWEWCSDWYDVAYGHNSTDAINPRGAATGDFRVLRGDSWYGYGQICRSACRSYNPPYSADRDIGFRVVFVP